MPRIVAAHRRQTVVCPLDQGGPWWVDVGTTQVKQGDITQYALALLFRYTPAQSVVHYQSGIMDLTPYAKVPLLRSIIDFAPSEDAVKRVAEVAVGQGTEDEDKTRVAEAMKMFNNAAPPPRAAALTTAIEEAQAIVSAWWWVRSWITSGMDSHFGGSKDILGTQLILVSP